MVTLRIEELAQEAADPEEAGRKMRQTYFCLVKLRNRQMTVDLFRKLVERKVGTNEVEQIAMKLVKGETKRNPNLVEKLLKIKLDDAIKWVDRVRKQFLREKASLYTSINRGGLLKEEYWTAVQQDMEARWAEGKRRILRKVDRLEEVYKGPRTDTGMVGAIRVGDRELGEEEEEEKEPLVAGTEVNQAEAKVLNLDPRFRDWGFIDMEEIETDLDVGLDNLRREINKVEENDGKTKTEEEEEREKQLTRVLDVESKTADFGRMRSTAMKKNKQFGMAKEVNRTDELKVQNLKVKLLEGSKKVVKKTNDDRGLPKESCYTEEEKQGMKSLVTRRKEEGLVICSTDKSQTSGAMSEAEWMRSMEQHTMGDPVVPMKEVDTQEKIMMGTAFQLARALGFGAGHGQEDKVRENLRSEHVSIPFLSSKIKDHKEFIEGEPVKVRPVVGAEESPNGQLSNTLSEVINILTKFENKHRTECRSPEEMRAEVKAVNARQAARGLDAKRLVIGSTDFKSYYPNIPVRGAAAVVRRMAEESELNIVTDTRELALFLASTMERREVERLGLGEVVMRRLHNAGAAPGITSREILSRGPLCPTKWREPERAPTEEERRRMLGLMLESSIISAMEHHYYLMDGEVKRQAEGCGIGLRLSEALGRAYGLDWDGKLIRKLRNLNWTPEMIQRYVDDLNAVLEQLEPGTRYNEVEEKLEVIEENVEEDMEKEKDETTMEVFRNIANSIDQNIEVEVDFPSKHEDKMMPILDMKMAIDTNNLVKYQFYKKPMANKYTMMARSALPDKMKRSSLTNEAMRRLLCCSPNLEKEKRDEIMEDFARMLRRSGYQERFRHEVISDAVRGFEKKEEEERRGGRPVDRPKEYEESERRKRKEDKGERFYRKESRGSQVREGLFIIPATPNSILAKEMRRICKEELKDTNISITIQERGGRRLGSVLGVTLPGRSKREACGRATCFPCNTGCPGVCRKTGVGYEIQCSVCNDDLNIVSKYAGESGKNLFMRGEDYVRDVARNATDKPLGKHIKEKHMGIMEVPMFSHFAMRLKQFFRHPQRRKANEGVRIAHLDPDTRMNSKEEFRQGTNIGLRVVRGVGDV